MLPGSSYDEVVANARKEFNKVRRLTKRQPYVRSKYFAGDKVFLTIFWDHLMQKHLKERTRRLKFYLAALDTLRNASSSPESLIDNKIILHRFYATTKSGESFCVQVKHDSKTGRKDFMSVFAKKPSN